MGIGEKSRELHLDLDQATAFNAVAKAADAIGKILEQNEAVGTLTVRTRYGLKKVKLHISVTPDANGSLVSISAFSDDLFGGGARRGTDKLLRALDAELSELTRAGARDGRARVGPHTWGARGRPPGRG